MTHAMGRVEGLSLSSYLLLFVHSGSPVLNRPSPSHKDGSQALASSLFTLFNFSNIGHSGHMTSPLQSPPHSNINM